MIYGKISFIYDPLLQILGIKRGLNSFLSQIKLCLPINPVILDAGCGTGALTFSILKHYPNATVYAFDIDDNMLKALRKQQVKKGISSSRLITRQGDLKNIDQLYQNNFFDCIVISGALEYAPLKTTIINMSKIIKKGGVFVNIGVKESWVGWFLKKIYSFNYQKPEYIIDSLKKNNFFDIKIIPLTIKSFPANLSRIGIIARKK